MLIIGQGLAGTWLSFHFLKEGIPFEVIDKGHTFAASNVATGLVNPLVPKRLKPTWRHEDLFFGFINEQYRAIEKTLQQQFFFPDKPVYKLFFEKDDVVMWSYAREKGMEYLLGAFHSEPICPHFEPHLGYAEIIGSAWVNTPFFIQSYRTFLLKNNLLRNEDFTYEHFSWNGNTLRYAEKHYAAAIFCQGFEAMFSPLFPNLKLNPVKGEELVIRAKQLKLTKTVNSGLHIVPLENDYYAVGSTFKWDDLSYEPTLAVKEEILQRLRRFYKGEIEVMEHKAGIRPAALHRRPIIGFTDSTKRIGIINGLGTKGLTLAPLMANYFTQHFKNNHPIPEDVAYER